MNNRHKHFLLSLLLTASCSLSLTAMDTGFPGAGAETGMAASGSSAESAEERAAHIADIADLLIANQSNYQQRTQAISETERNAIYHALLKKGLEALETFTLNPSFDLYQRIEVIAILLKNDKRSAYHAQLLAAVVQKELTLLVNDKKLSDEYVTALLYYWQNDKLLNPTLLDRVPPSPDRKLMLKIIETASADAGLIDVTLLSDYLEKFDTSSGKALYINSLEDTLTSTSIKKLNPKLCSILVDFITEQLLRLARFKSYPELLSLAITLSRHSSDTANQLCATILKTLTTKNCAFDILTSHGLTNLEPIMFIQLASILSHISNRTLFDNVLTLINYRAATMYDSDLIMLNTTQAIVTTSLLSPEEKTTMIPDAISSSLDVDKLGIYYVNQKWENLGYMLHALPSDTLYAIIHNLLEHVPLITTSSRNPHITAEHKKDRLCKLISCSLMKKNDHRTYQRADITFTTEQAEKLSCMAYDLLLWNTEERTIDPHTADLIPFLYHLTMSFTSQENAQRTLSLFLHHIDKKTESYKKSITNILDSPDDLPLLHGYVPTDPRADEATYYARKANQFFATLWWKTHRGQWLLACNADNIAEVRASRQTTETILDESATATTNN